MGRQVTLARESTLANLAYVGPFAGVPASVNRQRRPLRERFRALIALVRLLPRVHSPVHPQIFRIGETLAADVADIGLFAGVDSPVLLQVLGAAQTLAAVVAQVELRRIVTLFVAKERPLRGEHAAANVAGGAGHLVGLQLGMQASTVRGELSSQVEGAVAELTGERLLARVNVVVFLQVELLPETLVALIALEGQIRFVDMACHVNAERRQNGGLVVAFLAHVARVEVRLLVPRQIAEQSELLRTVFARKIADRVAQQMLLIIALVSEDLVAGLAEKLQLGLLFLHLLQ